VTADGSGHWQHRERRRMWLGVLPNYMHAQEQIDACVARFARAKCISLDHYSIEIELTPNLFGSSGRHVYAIRRRVDDIRTTLL
jgi:hypothetical protein